MGPHQLLGEPACSPVSSQTQPAGRHRRFGQRETVAGPRSLMEPAEGALVVVFERCYTELCRFLFTGLCALCIVYQFILLAPLSYAGFRWGFISSQGRGKLLSCWHL